MKVKHIIQKLIDYGILATLIVFPFSINIALTSPEDIGHPLIAVNLSLADIFIGVLIILWSIKVLIYKEWKTIKLPPVLFMFFVGVGILSFVNAFSISQWAKEVLQIIEYFILFYILLINNLKTTKIHFIKNALLVSTSIIVIIALIQYLVLKGDLYFVRGLFENRNVLGTFFCISLPFFYVELIFSKNILRKIWMFITIIISIVVTTSGSAIASVFISLFVVSWLLSKKALIKYCLSIIFIGIFCVLILPEKNIESIKNSISIYEKGNISENYYRRLAILENRDKITLFRKEFKENFIYVFTANYLDVKLPDIQKGNKYKEMNSQKNIKNRYLEMQASLNMLSKNTLFGVGMGNFQSNIGVYYNEIPKINTAEPNQNNGYLVTASTMGIFGLTVFIWIIFSLIKNNYSNFRTAKSENRGIYLSLLGSLVACAVENFFSVLLTSAIILPFIFLLFLSYAKLDSK